MAGVPGKRGPQPSLGATDHRPGLPGPSILVGRARCGALLKPAAKRDAGSRGHDQRRRIIAEGPRSRNSDWRPGWDCPAHPESSAPWTGTCWSAAKVTARHCWFRRSRPAPPSIRQQRRGYGQLRGSAHRDTVAWRHGTELVRPGPAAAASGWIGPVGGSRQDHPHRHGDPRAYVGLQTLPVAPVAAYLVKVRRLPRRCQLPARFLACRSGLPV